MKHLNGLHLSDDQLIAYLYGLAGESSKPHLDACPECRTRWTAMEQRRASMLEVAPIAESAFARQRRFVLENAHRPTPLRSPWLPASAAVLALAAIVLFRPSQPSPAIPSVAVSDPAPVLEAGWFDEAYQASLSVEPRAAQPLRELFTGGEQMP
jgi:anti-sigma factor RsiW